MKKFIFNLKNIRKSKGINQSELAKLMNTNQQQISKYENSVELPGLEKLVEIAISLDVTLDDLIEIKQIKENEKD
ncbi:MAG: helix-turn-helix transcriptional regulator [Candidatus Izemoplasmatales bacterium]